MCGGSGTAAKAVERIMTGEGRAPEPMSDVEKRALESAAFWMDEGRPQ